jgi:hypothetical protein
VNGGKESNQAGMRTRCDNRTQPNCHFRLRYGALVLCDGMFSNTKNVGNAGNATWWMGKRLSLVLLHYSIVSLIEGGESKMNDGNYFRRGFGLHMPFWGRRRVSFSNGFVFTCRFWVVHASLGAARGSILNDGVAYTYQTFVVDLYISSSGARLLLNMQRG